MYDFEVVIFNNKKRFSCFNIPASLCEEVEEFLRNIEVQGKEPDLDFLIRKDEAR